MFEKLERWLREPGVGRYLVAAAVALVGAVTLTITVVDDDHDGRPDRITVTVNDVEKNDGAPTTKISVPKEAVDNAAVTLEDRNLKNPPPATPPAVLKKVDKAEAKNKATTEALPTAGATQSVPGCVTRFVRNQSGRRGVRPVQNWLHYTVSLNRVGWSDVNAIVALFDRASFQASSHFVIDSEGHCAYIVPLENNAWTQAGGNRFGVNYEIIATGKERVYLAPAGYAKLRSVMRTVRARTGIPIRRGLVRNCVPLRSGIVQHREGGLCSGGHSDIGPFNMADVVRQLSTLPERPVAARWHSRCSRLNATRTKIAARQHVSTTERRKASELRAVLIKGGYRCSGSRAVRK